MVQLTDAAGQHAWQLGADVAAQLEGLQLHLAGAGHHLLAAVHHGILHLPPQLAEQLHVLLAALGAEALQAGILRLQQAVRQDRLLLQLPGLLGGSACREGEERAGNANR